VIALHVAVTTAPDYPTRREPHRQAHIQRLLALRAAGRFVGGGPAPDGRSAELFYRVDDPAELAPLLDEDPYSRAGAWTGSRARSFAQFVEPWGPVPVVLDGSRPVTVVEGPSLDPGTAELALVELRGTRRLLFGGLLAGGVTVGVCASPDGEESAGWLAATGLWAREALATRPLLYVL
jgi:uncharacterized protein YciI